MQCVLIVAALMSACCSSMFALTDARWTIRPKPTTSTSTTTTTMKPSTWSDYDNEMSDSSSSASSSQSLSVPQGNKDVAAEEHKDEDRHYPEYYHPAENKRPYVVEQYDNRHWDGHYEFRYVLSNGDTRYERAYWLPVGHGKFVLARKGYFSYPMPRRGFRTVYYTADQYGYHEDSSLIEKSQPVLPRSMQVPEYEGPERSLSTTTTKPVVHQTPTKIKRKRTTTKAPRNRLRTDLESEQPQEVESTTIKEAVAATEQQAEVTTSNEFLEITTESNI